MLWENENLTDVAEYGPSLPCSARSLEHFLITATGVSVEWSNKPLPMYTLGSCCVQVGFGGFHRLCLTWSHFYFLKFVRGNETMHCSCLSSHRWAIPFPASRGKACNSAPWLRRRGCCHREGSAGKQVKPHAHLEHDLWVAVHKLQQFHLVWCNPAFQQGWKEQSCDRIGFVIGRLDFTLT